MSGLRIGEQRRSTYLLLHGYTFWDCIYGGSVALSSVPSDDCKWGGDYGVGMDCIYHRSWLHVSTYELDDGSG